MLTDFADVFGAIEACLDEANKKTKTSEVEQLRARVAELTAALNPVIEELVAAEAEYGELDNDELVYIFKLTYGDLRAARAALKAKRDD